MAVEFITEPIAVEYDRPPAFPRRPPCPQRLIWRGRRLAVARLLGEWRRHTPKISSTLARLGVARVYFRVRLEDDRVYDIYFDPVENRGRWYISKEIVGRHPPEPPEF